MVKCCFCINKDKDKKRGVRFHRLPNDVNIRALWLKQLGLNQADLSSEDICSDHFAYNDYENIYATGRNRWRIKTDAIPKLKVLC